MFEVFLVFLHVCFVPLRDFSASQGKSQYKHSLKKKKLSFVWPEFENLTEQKKIDILEGQMMSSTPPERKESLIRLYILFLSSLCYE